ncbi:ATP-binding protein [Embleya sp. NPDC059237]|uniref:ATP-binding protein n=1 Tax=Embleya sp. NPDC059237 TaxID=3346784 RepID=UPI00367ECF9D
MNTLPRTPSSAPVRIRFRVLPNTPGTSARVRAEVRGRLRTWGWPEERADDVVQVVSELVGNALRHTGGEARLRLTRTSDGVDVEVADHHRELLVLRRPADGDGGHGLHLLDLLTTHWTVEQHTTGKLVRAHIRR